MRLHASCKQAHLGCVWTDASYDRLGSAHLGRAGKKGNEIVYQSDHNVCLAVV
eukprot:XP_001705903.1 Hypothetical protein GL50803_36818 [Giardia lamblia ATCC 50803]